MQRDWGFGFYGTSTCVIWSVIHSTSIECGFFIFVCSRSTSSWI